MGTNASRTPGPLDPFVARALANAREQSGMSLRDFAAATGFSHNFAARYEAGDYSLTIRELAVLCETLRLDPVRVIRDAQKGEPVLTDPAKVEAGIEDVRAGRRASKDQVRPVQQGPVAP